jgi:adenylate cyclase
MQRAMRRSPKSLGAWDLYQQGRWHLLKLDQVANDEACRLFERAIALDPMFAAAYVGLALTDHRKGGVYLTMPMDVAARLAFVHARKAIELDPGDAEAQALLAAGMWVQGDVTNAIAIAQQALAINPNCALAHRTLGSILVFAARIPEGRHELAVFERLSPLDSSIPNAHRHAAISYYFEHDYARCAEVLRHHLSIHPDAPLTYRWLAAALGELGLVEEARVALEKALTSDPREFDVYVRSRAPYLRPEDHEHMLDGLRKAGWRG